MINSIKSISKITLILAISLTSCISWVFAKSPLNDMPSGQYQVDLSHASIIWKVSHLGLSNYVARFTSFDASIDFDARDITASKVTANIDPMSIQTAYPNAEKKDFDKALATEKGWFNGSEFTQITFNSTSIQMTGDNTAIMQGELIFLGVTKPVTLDVVINGAMQRQPFSGKPTMGFSATASISRSAWGMSKYVPQIGDNVSIVIEGEFARNDD
jgi:polyisoprenoid-binding protein YceI